MTETASIYKGDTFLKRVGYRLDDGTLATLPGTFTCKIKAASIGVERPVTDIGPDDDGTPDKRFLAALTPTEALLFAVGQHVVVIEVENAATIPPLRKETHIILTVLEHGIGSTADLQPETEVEAITAELAAVRAARAAFMAGGTVQEAWSGRYGSKMKYANPTLKDYNDMIVMLQRDLERAQNIEAGLPARGRIGFRWAS
jgi:hypothetical protein